MFINPHFVDILGHQNPINGSKVTAILLKGWILPVSGASVSAVEGLQSAGLPCVVLYALQPSGNTNQSFMGAFIKEYLVKQIITLKRKK